MTTRDFTRRKIFLDFSVEWLTDRTQSNCKIVVKLV